MLEWSDLALFLAVAREGGLSPAARVTGKSPATLGRRMQMLERALGRELFIRHDRGYELTADAQVFLSDLTTVEAQLTEITAPATNDQHPIVKLSAGHWTTVLLMEHFADICGSPPDVRLRFATSSSVLDMPHREVAIGIRNAAPMEPALAAQKLARVDFAAYGTAASPDRYIQVIATTPSAKWVAKHAGHDAICEVTAPRNALDLARAGVGVALLPTFIGDRQDGLQRRGEIVAELSHDQWLVMHQDDRHLPEVRRVIDRLRAILGR